MIRERTERDQTGSNWTLGAAQALSDHGAPESRDRRIVAAMLTRQEAGEPVHQWTALTESEMEGNAQLYQNVGDIMSTDLFTVSADDPLTLAAGTMTWRHIRHLPVEDSTGRFVGLVSSREILRVIAEQGWDHKAMTVGEVMNGDPLTVMPDMSTVEAVKLMLEQKIDCLPVVRDGELLGIVSSQDMMLVLKSFLMYGQGNDGLAARPV